MAGSMHMFDTTLTSAWRAGGWSVREVGAGTGDRIATGAAQPHACTQTDTNATVVVSSLSEHSTPRCPVPHLKRRWLGYGAMFKRSRFKMKIESEKRARTFAKTSSSLSLKTPIYQAQKNSWDF